MKHSSLFFHPKCATCNISMQAHEGNHSGSKRFQCGVCEKYQTPKKKESRRPLQKPLDRIWFDRSILGGYTVKQISQVTHFHPRWIQSELHRYLDEPVEIINSSFDQYFTTSTYLFIHLGQTRKSFCGQKNLTILLVSSMDLSRIHLWWWH